MDVLFLCLIGKMDKHGRYRITSQDPRVFPPLQQVKLGATGHLEVPALKNRNAELMPRDFPGHEAMDTKGNFMGNFMDFFKHRSKMTPRCNQCPCTINAKEMVTSSLPALLQRAHPYLRDCSMWRVFQSLCHFIRLDGIPWDSHGIPTMDYDNPHYVVGITSVQPPITINHKGFWTLLPLMWKLWMGR